MRIVSQPVAVSSIQNCRDLGGIPTQDGRVVKEHVLLRSANLHRASEADLNTLNDMGIRSIIDLRSKPERRFKADHLLKNWQYYALPTFRESKELGLQMRDIISRPGTFIEDLYPHLILDDAAVECWKTMFRLLIDQPGGYLFHCTQGKDRTGVAAALILAALNVEESLIRDDYLQTNLYMTHETPDFVKLMLKHLGGNAEVDIDEFLVAAPLYFETYLDSTQSFGGPVGYLHERIGLSDGDFTKLREQYSTAVAQED